MKNKSIWINSRVKNSKLSKLDKDIECDVLIIGGGMAGLSVAYNLMNSDKKVVLIEKNVSGLGATSKNTGKLTWMQGLIYSKLEKNYNSKVAKLYYDSQVEAINRVKKIISDNKIECHLTKTKSYVFSYNDYDYYDFGICCRGIGSSNYVGIILNLCNVWFNANCYIFYLQKFLK